MKKSKDSLGDRMKAYYENVTKVKLPRRTYTVIRIDGKAFHSYTKGLERPFDEGLIKDMDEAAIKACKEIQGAKLAFVQSDEISIICTDFDKLDTQAYFKGDIQKITSVTASEVTEAFNRARTRRAILDAQKELYDLLDIDIDVANTKGKRVNKSRVIQKVTQLLDSVKPAKFDSRVFTIPTRTEVINYLIWRQQDTTRNSISSVAQSLYSHKELENKNTNEMQDMSFKKGVNWNDFDAKLKRGRLIVKEYYSHKESGTTRSKWVSKAPEIFTSDKTLLEEILPLNE